MVGEGDGAEKCERSVKQSDRVEGRRGRRGGEEQKVAIRSRRERREQTRWEAWKVNRDHPGEGRRALRSTGWKDMRCDGPGKNEPAKICDLHIASTASTKTNKCNSSLLFSSLFRPAVRHLPCGIAICHGACRRKSRTEHRPRGQGE